LSAVPLPCLCSSVFSHLLPLCASSCHCAGRRDPGEPLDGGLRPPQGQIRFQDFPGPIPRRRRHGARCVFRRRRSARDCA
jgi:hypothetical protein